MRTVEPRGAALAEQGRLPSERIALVDLLDRLLAGGVVVSGDLILTIADIDLVRISLRALIMSVRETDTVAGRHVEREMRGHGPIGTGAGDTAEPPAP